MIRNLGQVAAIYIGSSAPRNTNLIWLDNTVVPFVFRAYDGSAWSEIATHKWVRAYVDGWLVTLPPRQLADDGDYMLINSNNVNYKITVKDFVKSAVGNPLDFKGVIRVSADFPNPSTLESGDMYVIITSPAGGTVTDPYSGKTFEDSEKIVWDEVTQSWESLGKIDITVDLITSYSETEVTIHSSAGKETTIQGATDQLAGVMLPGQYSWLQALSNGSIVPGDPSPLTPLTPAHKHNYSDIINRLVSQQGTGESTIDPMSQKATTDALNLKFDKASVLQVSGAATDKVMSQKAVTDALKTLSDDFNNKLTNYLPLVGGTMTGSINLPSTDPLKMIISDSVDSVLSYWPSNNAIEFGNNKRKIFLRTDDSNIIHYINGSSYSIYDAYNLPDPVTLSGNNTFTGNNTFQAGKFNVGPFEVTSSGSLLSNINLQEGSAWSRSLTFRANSDNTSKSIFGGYNSNDNTSIGYAYIGIGDVRHDTAQYKFYANSLKVPYKWSIDGPDGSAILWSQTSEIVNLGRAAGTTKIRSGNTDLIHTKGSTEYIIWDKSNLPNPVRYALDASNYPTLLDSNGSSFSYIKAGPSGILPNTSVSLSSGGTGYCGTLGWSFKDGYFANVHTYKILIGPNETFIDSQSGDSSHRGVGFYTSQNAACPVYAGSLCVSDSYANSAPNIPTNGIYSTGAIKSVDGFTSNFRQTNLNLAKTGNDVLYISSFVNGATGAPGSDFETGRTINDGMFLTYFWQNDNAFQLAADIDGAGIAYRHYIPSTGNSTAGWKFLADTNWVVSKINSSTSNFLKKTGDTATGQIILDSNGIAFKNNTWTNDLTPNRNYSGYLQVLDAYDASSAGDPTNYGTVLQVNSRNAHWANQLWFSGGAEASKNGLYYRHMAYNETTYGEWHRLLTNKDVNILSASYNNNPNSLPTNQIFYAETQGVTGTPTSSGLLFSVQGDDEGIQLWAGANRTELYYRTKWTSYGNWIKLATTSDIGNYLPLTGGTLSGQLIVGYAGSTPLIVNNSYTNGVDSILNFRVKGVNKALVGYSNGNGPFIQDASNNRCIMVKSDGAYFGTGLGAGTKLALITDIPTVSGYLPLTGGNLTGKLSIKSSGSNLLILDSSSSTESVIHFLRSSTSKGAVGYYDNIGAFIYNFPSNTYLFVKDDGKPYVGTKTDYKKILTETDITGYATQTWVNNKGYLTSHQTIYNLTFQAGTFAAKTFDPNGAAATVNIPTKTSHITNDSGFITSSALSGYATRSWANGQFAPLSRFNTSTGYTTIKVVGQEFNFDSADPEIYMNYRTLSGSTAVTKITWKAGGGVNSTALCEGRWGNLYMNNNLVATQSWAAGKFPNKTGAGASGTWGISISGNATTATTASKLGSTTIGGSAKPIYLSSGTPTACSATVGSATVPVYMNAGTITQCSTTLGVSITGNAATATNSTQLGGTAASSYVKANDNISRLTNDSGYATQEWVNSQNFVKSTSTKKVTDIQPVDALPATQASGVLYLVFG